MNFKKLTALALVLVMLLSFAACGGDKEDPTTTTTTEETTTEAVVTTAEPKKVDGNFVATLKDGVLVDSNGTTITEAADGQKFVDDSGKVVAEVKGDKVVDASGKTILTVKDGKLLGADGQEITTTEPSTAPQGGNDNPSQGGNDTATTTKAPEADVLPSTKAEILAEYKKIMDQAKNVDKPGYTKLEYQELPKDKQDVRKGSVKMSIVNGLAGLFMTKKDKAEPEVKEKGSDMRWFPVYKATAGCLLTDASKVKSADCKKSGNNYVLTIVLNSEDNPEPAADKATSAPSATGGIFSPLSRTDIDNTLVNDERVSKVVKNFDYKLTYHDCKAVLTYNPETGHIVSLEQYMYVTIVAKGDILGTAFDATAELNNVMTINKFTY